MSKKEVRKIIASVRDAVSKECWIPALVTALTIPDLLGRVETSGSNNVSVGKRYKAWFTEHVEHRYADHHGWGTDYRALKPYFNADMCYDLRCMVLHQGNSRIKHEYKPEDDEGAEYRYWFELRANACDSYGTVWDEPEPGERAHKTSRVCVDVGGLCNAICDAAEEFIEDIDDSQFNDTGIRIVDLHEVAGGRFAPGQSG